ncbi:MAG: glycoside hydrolase family 38 C-terminal domain-containing protein [Paludibacter sp.]|nr:glycoside hydrolase family 38 C-terminal domain-containing protein [Paludibacter sp.]
MKTYKLQLLILMLIFSNAMGSQPMAKQQKFDLSKDKVLYTVPYSHLDTQWNWEYPTTIDEYIPNLLRENFYLFEKYPEYVFNFTGSRRYKFMKEYYPSMYEELKKYIRQGRWFVSGSSVDEGEVNVSSSESVVRQILYGNQYFRNEFGVVSHDYILPDCFGFLANMPTIWNHCGLLGFSTQKLTWRSAVGIPFNVGVWNGPDGKGVVAALNATDYTGTVVPQLDKSDKFYKRLDENKEKSGYAIDYRYFGVGDRAGAPRPGDVQNAINSLNNKNGDIKVILSSSDQMYRDITPEIREKLPVYTGELMLIEHSAGSTTSQSFMKKMNRLNEQTAQSAEQVSSGAYSLFGHKYPVRMLNEAWELVLGSQFHDILPGTSTPRAYEYSWNDELVAKNLFDQVENDGFNHISSQMNTLVKGQALVVYNPAFFEREDIASAEIEVKNGLKNIKVLNSKGELVPSQIISTNGNKIKFIFLAKVRPVGFELFEVMSTNDPMQASSLKITTGSLENANFRIILDANGDIISVVDKKLKRELLSSPAKLEFLKEDPQDWPAWNMDWKDRKNPPVDYLNKEATIKVLEEGPVRIALQITRKGRNSTIKQIISLAAGSTGERVEISNELDWKSSGVSLKASFPLSASNDNATYNLGVGTIERNTNHEKKFEVQQKGWFDLTDVSGKFGVSVLEDCKYGSDKPDKNTLRLTLMFTPETHDRYVYQNTQDWGVHTFRYGLYSHAGNWSESNVASQAEFFNKQLVCKVVNKHEGLLGKSISLLKTDSKAIGLMALKKAEDSDYLIIRLNELTGNDHKNVTLELSTQILDAFEVNGQEVKTGTVMFSGKKLTFNMGHYTIKSFAVKLKRMRDVQQDQQNIKLPYNFDAFSFDQNRWDTQLEKRLSYPAELIPQTIACGDINFRMGDVEDQKMNVVVCKGQSVELPEGYQKVYLLLASASKDIKAGFLLGSKKYEVSVPWWRGMYGQHYRRIFEGDFYWEGSPLYMKAPLKELQQPFVKEVDIAWFATHHHHAYPSKNVSYQFSYIYKVELIVPEGTKNIKLPEDENVMLFAMTVSK